MYNEIIKVLGKEIEFYSKIQNSNWTIERNKGFKDGIEYCYNLIKNMKKTEGKKYNFPS